MVRFNWKRAVCVFIAFIVIASLFSFVGRSLIENKAIAMLISAIGALVGLSSIRPLFGNNK